MVQDLFSGEAARRKQSYVSVVLTIMPLLAPAIGAGVIMISGWRSVHLLMALGGLLLIAIVALFVGESRSAPSRRSLRGMGFADSVWMLRDDGFRRVAIVNALSYGAIFAYIAGAPVVVISQLGYTNTVYAIVFACTAAALSAGAITSARLGRRFNSRRLVWPALVIQAVANVGLLLAALATSSLGQWALFPLLLVGCFVRGIISPNLVHVAISGHRDQAGLAAALVGLAQLTTASASSALLARLLETFGVVSVASIMAALSLAAVTLWVSADVGRVVAERG